MMTASYSSDERALSSFCYAHDRDHDLSDYGFSISCSLDRRSLFFGSPA